MENSYNGKGHKLQNTNTNGYRGSIVSASAGKKATETTERLEILRCREPSDFLQASPEQGGGSAASPTMSNHKKVPGPLAPSQSGVWGTERLRSCWEMESDHTCGEAMMKTEAQKKAGTEQSKSL